MTEEIFNIIDKQKLDIVSESIEKAQEDGLLFPTQESLSTPASPLEETEKKN